MDHVLTVEPAFAASLHLRRNGEEPLLLNYISSPGIELTETRSCVMRLGTGLGTNTILC